jgi:hypothetical protein
MTFDWASKDSLNQLIRHLPACLSLDAKADWSGDGSEALASFLASPFGFSCFRP